MLRVKTLFLKSKDSILFEENSIGDARTPQPGEIIFEI